MQSTSRIIWLVSAGMGLSILLGGCGMTAGGPKAGNRTSKPSAHHSGGTQGKSGASRRSGQKGVGGTGGQVSAKKTSGSKAGAARTLPWMTYATAAKTATLKLVAGYNSSLSGFNFNGYGNGQMVVSIPTGWRVTVDFSNQGQLPHSAAIVHTATSTRPAFPGAGLPGSELTAGIPSGKSATFSFTTGAPGNYRIVCLVPGHEGAGMWDTLTVTSTGKIPSIKP